MTSQDSKLAAVLIELESKVSKLPSVDSPMEALERLQSSQQNEMGEQYARMLGTDFPWWQIRRSPFHAMRFFCIKRKYAHTALNLSRSDWVRLKALVVRIRFGFYIDDASTRLLEYLIRQDFLTERDAWRLLHSPGCRISEEGLEPAPLSPIAGNFGLSISLSLGILAVLLLQPLLMSLLGECKSPICQIVGDAVLASWSLLTGYLVAVCTWGRRDAAKVLSRLLELDFNARQAELLAVKRPLVVRLLW